MIPTTSYHTQLSDLATTQETEGSKVYKILQKDDTAHVVQVLMSPKSWSALGSAITAYVMFRSTDLLPPGGPVEKVSSGNCLIMAKETTEFIYLSISYPDLNLNNGSNVSKMRERVGEEFLYTSNTEKAITVSLWNQVTKAIAETQVHGTPDHYTPDEEISSNGKDIHFKTLKNGFSVEVKLTRFS